MELFKEIDGQFYLLAHEYKLHVLAKEPDALGGEQHGPAATVPGNRFRKERDMVACLKCDFWPQELKGTLKRLQRLELSSRILSSFHVVPVSHAESKRPDIEFRMSFSVIEKHLIRKWCLNQARCYGWSKVIKGFFGSVTSETKMISSYLIKTLMFWTVEEAPNEVWDNLTDCIHSFWRRMEDRIRNRCLPNYFVPDNNLLDSFSEKDLNFVLFLVSDINPMSIEVINIRDNKIINSIQSRIHIVENCRGYILDFQRFCLDLYCCNEEINHLSLQSIIDSLMTSRDESGLSRSVELILNRCLALYKLSDAFYTVDDDEATLLLQQTENLLLQSLELPEELLSLIHI